MAKHYKIDEANKVIYADILALTEKEETEVEKFVKFGFKVENKTEKKETVKRLTDAYIVEYLKEKAPDMMDEYTGRKNAPAVDESGKVKTTSKGKTKTQGFNAGRNWFAKTFPTDLKEVNAAIKKAGMEKTLADLYAAYEKKDVDGSEKMSKDEYTRNFYWKKVFEA